MASNINVAVPVFGKATTASVRQNFVHAKAEIEALQTGKLNATAQDEINALKLANVLRLGNINETVEVFQRCTTNDVGQVVQFNTQLFNSHTDVFEWDILNNEIVIKKAGWYSWMLSFHVVRKIGTGAVDWTLWAQTKEPPAGTFSNFPGSGRRLSLAADEANGKAFQSLGFAVHTPVDNTRVRFMHACTDVTKDVGLISYPASGSYPSIAGVMLSIHQINLEP